MNTKEVCDTTLARQIIEHGMVIWDPFTVTDETGDGAAQIDKDDLLGLQNNQQRFINAATTPVANALVMQNTGEGDDDAYNLVQTS